MVGINSGNVTVAASAIASGADFRAATGRALGYSVIAEPLALPVANSGTMKMCAASTSDGLVAASATGMSLLATADPTAPPPESSGNGGGGP